MGALSENWIGGFRVIDDGRQSAANYIWDTGTLSWIAQTAGGSGPSGDVNIISSIPLAVTGPLTDAQLRATPVPISVSKPTGNARSSVAGAVANTLLLASNAARLGATIYNDSTAILYLALGTAAASTTDYTVKMVADAYYEVPFGYTGEIRGIWASATGAARVGELT